MISIQHHRLEMLAQKHWEAIELHKSLIEKDKLNAELSIIFENVNGKSYNLKMIVLAKPNELEVLANHYKNNLPLTNESAHFWKEKMYKNYFSTTNKQLKDKEGKDYNAWTLVKNLGITICPYCNINAIYNLEEGKRTSEIDHFYSKEKYPFLAMSFYNLIPSCKVCNKIKMASEEKIINPYDERYNLNEQMTFKLKITKPSFYYDLSGFDIEIVADSKIKIEVENAKNEVFRLKERYEYHKDIVREIIQKEYTYNDSYIDELFRKYEGTLFKNREDVIKHLLGTYIETENLHKRPLSKLTKDIATELGLIP